MFTTLNKYRALALAIGLGSLVAYGGDSPASNPNQVVDTTANGEIKTISADTPTNNAHVSEGKLRVFVNDDGGGGACSYPTVPYRVNGNNTGHMGYVINGADTFVHWGALSILGIPNEYHTYEGGFFIIEGRRVKAYYVDGETYIMWHDLSTRIQATRIVINGVNGWNFTLKPLSGGGLNNNNDDDLPSDWIYHKSGWAMCNGDGKVWENPSYNSVESQTKKYYGDRAWVSDLIKDTSGKSNFYYAKLPGWGANGTNGYMNIKFLTPGFPIVNTDQFVDMLKNYGQTHAKRTNLSRFICKDSSEAVEYAKLLNEMAERRSDEPSEEEQLTEFVIDEIRNLPIHAACPACGIALTVKGVFDMFTIKTASGGRFVAGGNIIQYYAY